jgi:hypothetical protein
MVVLTMHTHWFGSPVRFFSTFGHLFDVVAQVEMVPKCSRLFLLLVKAYFVVEARCEIDYLVICLKKP